MSKNTEKGSSYVADTVKKFGGQLEKKIPKSLSSVVAVTKYLGGQAVKSLSEALYSGSKKYQAVQIFKPREGGRYSLDKVALETILSQEDLANHPIAIYSIAGAYRTGKSLVLNLFLRFLKSDKSSDWLKNKHEEVSQGFEWRGGDERCTAGIWMWNEPFFLKDKEGKEFVLFLVDTQGSFDNESDTTENSLIFALSTLISSVQIYNLNRNIQENDLQHLHLFTDYALKAKKQSKTSEEKAFQNLLFLIRDYHNKKYRRFEGGREVLNKFLTIKKESKELKSVRQNLAQSFETMKGFCASYPGEAVAERDDQSPPLKLNEIRETFLNEVDELVHHLFVENVVIKRMNGNIVTACQLINFIIAYCDVFESGNMPEVYSILTATAKAAHTTAVQKLSDSCYTKMMQACTSKYRNPTVLNELLNRLKTQTLQEFDEVPKLGDDDLTKQYRGHLCRLIEQKFAIFKQANSQQLAMLRSKVRKMVDETLRKHSFILKKKLSENSKSQDIHEIGEVSKNEAMNFFKKETETFDSEVVQPFEEKLQELLKRDFERFQESKRLQLKKMEMELSQEFEKSKELYSEGMNRECGNKPLEPQAFEDLHAQLSQMAILQFDAYRFGSETFMKEEIKSALIKEIEKMKDIFYKANEDKMKVFQGNVTIEAMNRFRQAYNEAMKEKIHNQWLPPSRMNVLHITSKQKAFSIIVEEYDQNVAKRCYENIQTSLDTELDKVRILNKSNLNKAVNLFHVKAREALNVYNRKMQSIIHPATESPNKFLNDDDLQNIHQSKMLKAVNIYTSVKREPFDEFDRIKKELQKDIQTQMDVFVSKNTQNKEKAEDNANQVIEDIKTHYLEAMNKMSSEGYVEQETLQKAHNHAKKEFLKASHKECVRFPSKLKQLEDDLQALFEKIQQDNESNKPFVLRRLGNFFLDRFVNIINAAVSAITDLIAAVVDAVASLVTNDENS